MNSRQLFSSVALAALACLTACGGGGASDDSAASQSQASSVGGIGGSGVASVGGIGGSGVESVGGIGGSGVASVGGIGGTGSSTQSVGGIGGSGIASVGGIGGSGIESVGGIGGSGVNAQSVGGIGGSGIQSVGGIGGSGIQSVAHVQACGLRSVSVTVAGARVNANGAADLGSEGWVDVALAAPVQVDLLQLAAGGALPLNLSALPDGSYRQIRLLVVADDAANPLADTIVTTAGVQTPLSVPSAAQGGLPMAVSITVAGGQVSASYRDLDVCSAVTTTAGSYALSAVSSGTTQVASAY